VSTPAFKEYDEAVVFCRAGVTIRAAPSCAQSAGTQRSGSSSWSRFALWSAIRGSTSVRYATGSIVLSLQDETRLRLIA